MNSTLSNMKAYGEMCYNFNEFFILFSLIFLLISSSFFFSITDPISHPLIFSSSPSILFHAHAHTNADASLPRRSLSSCGFSFFFFFFGCGLMGGLGNGWLWMDRSVVGGFGWADRCPPRSTVHLTLSDQIALVFFFFFFFFGVCGLCFMGCNGLMLVGYSGGWADFHGL